MGTAITPSRSRYVLCTHQREPLEIDIHTYRDPASDIYLTYWVRVFQEFERSSTLGGLTFYIVWHYRLVPDLPSYGDEVVAVLLMDESWLTPHYVNKVRFVFKTYGFRPWLSMTPRSLNPAVILKFAKDCSTWASHLAALVRKNGLRASRHRSMVLPLGYAMQTDLPAKPFEARRYMVGFLGSVEQNTYRSMSPRALLGTPKGIARAHMITGLRKLAARTPNDVFCAMTGSYNESILAGGAGYSEVMADTRISLAPRGSSVETYRFFEAMRQGCVVVCDRLPPHWFYVGCPAVQIDDWRNLEAVIAELSADPQRLTALHRASLEWWDTKLSEPAVAAVMVACLTAGN